MDQEEREEPNMENAIWDALSLPKLAAFVTAVETASYFSKDTGFPVSMLLLGAFTVSLSVKAAGRAIVKLPSTIFSKKRQAPTLPAPTDVVDDKEPDHPVKRWKPSDSDDEDSEESEDDIEELEPPEQVQDLTGSSSSSEDDEEDEEDDDDGEVMDDHKDAIDEEESDDKDDEDEDDAEDEEKDDQDGGRSSPDLLIGRSGSLTKYNDNSSSLKTEDASKDDDESEDESEDDFDDDEDDLKTHDTLPMTQDVSVDDFMPSQSFCERFVFSTSQYQTPNRAAWKPSPSLSASKQAQQRYLEQPTEQNCLKAVLEIRHHQYHCQKKGQCSYFGDQCQQWAVYEAHVKTCPTQGTACPMCSKTVKLLWEHHRRCAEADCDIPMCVLVRSRSTGSSQWSDTQ